jgi:sugar phosphate isomerase/epimerase
MDMSRLAVSQISTNCLGFEEAVKAYSSKGIGHVGIWTDKIENIPPTQVKAILEEHGVKPANLCFAGMFTSDSAEKRQAAVDNAKKTAEQCKEIGAGFLLIVSGPALPGDLEGSRDQMQRALEELVPFAENIGTNLALEAIHPIDISRWTVLVTLGQVFDVVKSFSSPNLGILLDLYNSWWEPGIEATIPQIIDKVFDVHIADWHSETTAVDTRLLPGQGIIPLPRLIKTIVNAGYQGLYDVEIFNPSIWDCDEGPILDEIVRWWKELEV